MALQQKLKIDLPPGLDDKTKDRIAWDIITFIQDRAINNTGFNPETGRNKKFPPYNKDYASKKGASPGDVDLVLSADMFNAMTLLRMAKNSVTIGFQAGSDDNAKAEGNQLGTYGQPEPIPGKARPFLGLTKTDLQRIIDKYSEAK